MGCTRYTSSETFANCISACFLAACFDRARLQVLPGDVASLPAWLNRFAVAWLSTGSRGRQKNWCKTRQALVLHTRHGKWRHVSPPLGIPRCFEVALSSVKKFVYSRYHARLGQLSQRNHISWKDIGFLICSPHTEDLLAIMKNDIVHCRCTQMYATSKKHVPRDSLCISWKSEYAVSTSTFGGS